jgi:hypothetical protein
MTAGELLRAMDLYRQLSGKPLVEPGAAAAVVAEPAAPPEETVPPVEVTPATTAAVVVEPEKPASTPASTDATVTALDVTRKRT